MSGDRLILITGSHGDNFSCNRALSCRAFSYSTTQRHDSTLRLNSSLLDLPLIDSFLLHLEPRSIYTILGSVEHG